MTTNIVSLNKLYLWSKYIILFEIMLTSINNFFMSGADMLVLTCNWS